MPDNYIIEFHSNAAGRTIQAGIVVRDGGGFRFFAAVPTLNSLEGRVFKSPKTAEDAVRRRFAELASRWVSSPTESPHDSPIHLREGSANEFDCGSSSHSI
jgi:hypothetical protein